MGLPCRQARPCRARLSLIWTPPPRKFFQQTGHGGPPAVPQDISPPPVRSPGRQLGFSGDLDSVHFATPRLSDFLRGPPLLGDNTNDSTTMTDSALAFRTSAASSIDKHLQTQPFSFVEIKM